jgi:hypothetical protein
MVSSEVQRTLVKSPPELWAELSDPASLARHLGELGEIRITRTEPESTVEWAGEKISGKVSIKPSGWGTNVTLSVSREIVVDAPAAPPAVEPPPPAAETTPPAAETTPPAAEPTPRAGELDGHTDEPSEKAHDAAAQAVDPPDEPTAEAPQRLGFFARLFRRRGRATPAPAPPDCDLFAPVREALTLETFAARDAFAPPPSAPSESRSAQEPNAEEASAEKGTPTVDIAAELKAAEEVAAEEVTAVLTAVLDRLGAAHHRPFSRA